MARYLTREKARFCPIHQAIQNKVIQLLNDKQYFSKEEVLIALSFEAVEDSIRWDYIVNAISIDNGVDLIPLAQRFFKPFNGKKKLTGKEQLERPEQCMATGHGKKTFGYCNMFLNGGIYAVQTKKYKESMRNGVQKAFENYVSKLTERNILEKDSKSHLVEKVS